MIIKCRQIIEYVATLEKGLMIYLQSRKKEIPSYVKQSL